MYLFDLIKRQEYKSYLKYYPNYLFSFKKIKIFPLYKNLASVYTLAINFDQKYFHMNNSQ